MTAEDPAPIVTPLHHQSHHADDRTEPLLVENNKRFVLFPIQYHKIWMSYKHAESQFWSAEEIEVSEDVEVWHAMSEPDKNSVSFLVGFLLTSNFTEETRFLHFLSNEVQAPEARCMFGFQIMQSNIHQEFFNVLLDYIVNDPDYTKNVTATLAESQSIKARYAWIQKYILDSPDPFSTRLLSITLAITLFNSAAFHLLLKVASIPLPGATPPRPCLPGTVHAFTKILNDYRNYTDFLLILLSHTVNRIPADVARERVATAVEVEKGILKDIVATCSGTVSAFGADVAKIVEEAGEVLYRAAVSEELRVGAAAEISNGRGSGEASGEGEGKVGGLAGAPRSVEERMPGEVLAPPAPSAAKEQTFTLDEDF
ncbi:Ribonucleotide-diphosphate reductase (RNR), small subunit [Phlyctochytrium bullatum]|nr:Ribonucleotide-diphosphate reductase (RNR), small subunit [Phlyctochytrium bullatum]